MQIVFFMYFPIVKIIQALRGTSFRRLRVKNKHAHFSIAGGVRQDGVKCLQRRLICVVMQRMAMFLNAKVDYLFIIIAFYFVFYIKYIFIIGNNPRLYEHKSVHPAFRR